MKRLYDENDAFTLEANQLHNQVLDVLQPVFEKWAEEQDYSRRDIQSVISGAVLDLTLASLLGVELQYEEE